MSEGTISHYTLPDRHNYFKCAIRSTHGNQIEIEHVKGEEFKKVQRKASLRKKKKLEEETTTAAKIRTTRNNLLVKFNLCRFFGLLQHVSFGYFISSFLRNHLQLQRQWLFVTSPRIFLYVMTTVRQTCNTMSMKDRLSSPNELPLITRLFR